MAVNTRIQVRRGYSAGYPLGGQVFANLPVSGNRWVDLESVLSQGEIGYEIDTGRFKIGKDGITTWGSLPYAGGSDIVPKSGVAVTKDTSSNLYNIFSVLSASGNGLVINSVSYTGDGSLNNPSGSYYSLSLDDRLQALANYNSSGILVGTNESGVIARSLSSGNNITILNPNGISNNPIIGLNSSLTGLASISGNNNFSIVSNSGISINAGSGVVSVDDLTVNGYLAIGAGIDIMLAARILAQGPIVYSGNPTIYSGSVYYSQTPYVGPTGGGAVPVSLSGHNHSYTDITNFCSGVASCVDTSLLPGTGIQFISGGNSLTVGLSGQALAIHNLNTNGLVARSGSNTFVSRTISPSGSNIWIGNGDGVSANPTIGLSPNIALNSVTASDVTINNNLVVNGTTVIANVDSIVVEDPIMTLGKSSGTIVANTSYDRGVALVLNTGLTAFMGWDTSLSKFVLYSSGIADSVSGTYTAGTWGSIRAGDVEIENATANTLALFDSNKKLVSFATGNLVPGNRTVTPGSGLDGSTGLTLSSDITLNIGAGDGIVVGTDTVAVNSSFVRTTGTQNISGIKTFADRPVFSSGITTTGIIARITSAGGTGTYFPVFTGDPTSVAQTVGVRTTSELKTDLSLNNVTNDTQVKKLSSSTSGYVPTWNGTTGDALNNGYQASNQNIGNSLVLRDSNGSFFAQTIVSSGGFSGNGSSITGINAVNITGNANLPSGVLPTVTLSSPFPATDSSTSLANFINSITVDRAGRVIAATTGVYRDATTTVKGIASFSSSNFDVASGAVSVKTGGISNTNLANSTITVGNTSISLGGTGTSLAGLTSVTANSFVGSGNQLTDVNAYNLNIYTTGNTDTITSLVLVTGNNTGNYRPFVDTALKFNASTNALILESISGSFSWGGNSAWRSTTISGISTASTPTQYLVNFIIDGGTP
jgi:hypothetical protein